MGLSLRERSAGEAERFGSARGAGLWYSFVYEDTA